MLLEKGAHLAVEHVGTLEIRGMPGGGHALEARAGDVLVDLVRQLGPDQAVLVAREEHGGNPRGGIVLRLRGEAAEPFAKIGGGWRVEPCDLRVEERLTESRVPEHGGTGRTGRGQPLAQGRDIGIAEIAYGVRKDDGPKSPGRLHSGPHRRPSAHRLRDHRSLLDPEMIEERQRIRAESARPGAARHVRRLPEAPLVHRDAAILLREDRHLLPPAQVIAARPVKEQDRRPAASRVLVVETKAVLHHEGHIGHPLAAASTAAVSYSSWNSTIVSPRNVQKSDFGVSSTRPVFRLRQPVEPSMATRLPSAMKVPVV